MGSGLAIKMHLLEHRALGRTPRAYQYALHAAGGLVRFAHIDYDDKI